MCSNCGKSFSTEGLLDNHLKDHGKEKWFKRIGKALLEEAYNLDRGRNCSK
jgi:hypothetical protein